MKHKYKNAQFYFELGILVVCRASSGKSEQDEFAKQSKVQKLHRHWSVNDAGIWNESY